MDILREETARGRVSRRDFMQLSALLGVSAAATGMGLGKVRAESETITLSNYGGDAIKAYTEAWGDPFKADTGITVAIDGSGPLLGRVKKMVDDGLVSWDVTDVAPYYGLQLGADYAEKIDYSVVDESKFFPWNKNEFAAGNYVYSSVLAYDSSKFDQAPTSWVDFFDLKKFPGKRAMYKWFDGQPESCLLGAGKSMNEIYPMDMKVVAEMIGSLGDNLVLWDSGAVSQQLFLDGEVVMGNLWNTRARQLERDTNGRVTWIWDQQIVQPAAWLIPKGSKHVAAAQKFIASTQNVERQIKLLELMGNGPANPETLNHLTQEQKRLNPTSHLDVALAQDSEWYAANYNDALDAWTEAVDG